MKPSFNPRLLQADFPDAPPNFVRTLAAVVSQVYQILSGGSLFSDQFKGAVLTGAFPDGVKQLFANPGQSVMPTVILPLNSDAPLRSWLITNEGNNQIGITAWIDALSSGASIANASFFVGAG